MSKSLRKIYPSERSQPCRHCGASRGVRCYVKGATVVQDRVINGKRVHRVGLNMQPEPVSVRPHKVRDASALAAAKYTI